MVLRNGWIQGGSEEWLGSMSFDDKRLELMYDRYVAKFGDYGVVMLIVLLSLGCLTGESHDYEQPLIHM